MFAIELITVDERKLAVQIHDAPHLDEAAAVWLMQHFAWEEGKLDELLTHYPDEVITIGCGGGPLDEHVQNGGKRERGVCAATLAADWAGESVLEDPAAMDVLNFVMERDTKTRTRFSSPYDLARIMKGMNRRGVPPQRVVAWGVEGLRAAYYSRHAYYATKQEIKEKGQIHVFSSGDPEKPDLKLLVIVSDNRSIASYAFGEMNVAVVIQQGASGELEGNTQILTNAKFRIDMDDVTQVLRRVEQQFHLNFSESVPVTKWNDLKKEGAFPNPDDPHQRRIRDMPGWFFYRGPRMLLNGPESHPEVPPTKIPLETITELVIQCLELSYFDEERAEQCRQGNCTSTTQSPCPLYMRGLKRCRAIRYHQNHAGDVSR